MKIKRYTAASMRSALDQVRAEQGPDAVILSSRRIPEGIEVIAAVDYDETLMADARVHRMPEASPARGESSRADAQRFDEARAEVIRLATEQFEAARVEAARVEAARVEAARIAAARAEAARVGEASVEAAPPGVASIGHLAPSGFAVVSAPREADQPALDTGYLEVRRELQGLRHLLEHELANLAWHDRRMREPLKVQVLEDLSALDIAPDVAMQLAAHTPANSRSIDPANLAIALLAKYLPVITDPCVDGGVVAVVGPTGVGKTTTIAKLAASWSLRHGSESIALVSTDCYRIGAREQLSTYARILGVPMHVANGGKELAQVLGRLESKKMVLIDTAGIGSRDVRLAEQLGALQLGGARVRVLLALPAQGEGNALEEITATFARLSPIACILTKLDEAVSLGAVISTAVRHRLPIAYLCDGQRVPEDIHAADRRRIWLVRAAMRLKERSPSRRDEAYLARNFGRGQAHA